MGKPNSPGFFEIDLRIRARFNWVNMIALLVAIAISSMVILNIQFPRLNLESSKIDYFVEIVLMAAPKIKTISRKKIK